MSNFIINPYRFGAKNATFGGVGTMVENGSTSASSGTSTLTGIASGDLVLALIQRGNGFDITGVTCDGNSMALLNRNDAGSAFLFDVWGWIATGAISSASITASYSTSATYLTINTNRWSGVASTTLLASSINAFGTSSTNRLAPSITTAERSLIIACGTDWDNIVTHTPQSGWTKRLDGSGTPLSSIQFLFSRVSDAGTFGGGTAFSTVAAAQQYMSMLLAFPLA